MGQNKEIKFVLMASGLISAFAMGSTTLASDIHMNVRKLRTLESLSPEERIYARQRIHAFLGQYPSLEVKKYNFVVDMNGEIYALEKDHSQAPRPEDLLAQPSCVVGD